MTRRSFVPLVFAAPAVLRAQATANRVVIDPLRVRANIDRRIWGSFLEHLGRAIYGGIYEPGSRLADAAGFRTDVAAEVRSMGVPIIRYPGGNFVSGYNWLDGVGPRDKRPTVLDRAWNSIETNQFGTNEFVAWARSVGAEPLIGTNFGTAAPEMSAALVEYCNVPGGTKWSNLRRDHGYAQPHAIRTWCLGNEMDGSWQIGHMPAREYGRKAVDAARQMRAVDPDVQLIACGSSGPGQPTFLEWDREVLEECYSQVDGISLHRYYGNEATGETGGNSLKYLALNLAMENRSTRLPRFASMSASARVQANVCGCLSTNGMSGTGAAEAMASVNRRRTCWKRSTTSKTRQYLGVSVSSVRRWRLIGGGPRWVRVGAGSIRYPFADLEAYVANLPGGGGAPQMGSR